MNLPERLVDLEGRPDDAAQRARRENRRVADGLQGAGQPGRGAIGHVAGLTSSHVAD